MWKAIIKFYFRNVRRQKLHFLIAAGSLATGLTCFVLFYFSLQYERSFDRSHLQADSIYEVRNTLDFNGQARTAKGHSMPFAPALVRTFPEVRRATRFLDFEAGLVESADRAVAVSSVKAVDSELFRIFTLPATQGNPETALQSASSAVLSRRTAEALFGSGDAVGKSVRIVRTEFNQPVESEFVVGAVIEDQPSNTTYKFEALIPIGSLFKEIHEDWRWSIFPTFALLSPEADIPELAGKIAAFELGARAMGAEWELKNWRIDLARLSEIHADDPRLAEYLRVFGAIALAVLLLACINSINLTTARGLVRSKEVGVRKVAGASVAQLVRQFLGESLLTTLAALVVALALIPIVIPVFQSLSGRSIVLSEIEAGPLAAGLAVLVLCVTLVSGLYPAFALAGVKPASLFKGSRSVGNSRAPLRKVLVFAQFAVSGALLVLALVVSRQFHFIKSADLGMKVDRLVVLNTNYQSVIQGTSLETLKGEFLANPGILKVVSSRSVPPNVSGTVQVKPAGSEDSAKAPWTSLAVDPDFLAAYRIRLVEGRFFSRDAVSDAKTAAVINETAARRLGPGSAIGKTIESISGPNGNFRDVLTVVGVVADFHGRSLHFGIEPLLIRSINRPGPFLTLHIQPGATAATLKAVRETWGRVFPGLPFEYSFLDDTFRKAYETEARFQGMIRAFSVIVLAIGCLGLFGLATYGLQRKRKEMGIRKVLGASLGRLTVQFFGEFARPVVLSNLMAWPAAYVLARQWLRGFAYQATIPVWVFMAGGTLALAVAFLTVGARILRAAAENPVESLRVE